MLRRVSYGYATGSDTVTLPGSSRVAESIVGFEAEFGALRQNDASARDPIGFLTVDEVSYHIERTECFGTLVGSDPRVAETVEQRPERGGRPSQHCDREVQVEIHRSEGVPRELPPRAHDDRYHQHLHEPVPGMEGGEPPRAVLTEVCSRDQVHRAP